MSAENPAPARAQHGRLLVCATPIGNLDDVTLRVLAALRDADVLACEDTRHTQILLDRHGISATRLTSLHEHNERAQAAQLAGRVRAGATVALVSDAGTPLISDPGFALVRTCLEQGLPVQVLPGPSAVVAGLVVSGLPGERWRFVGFLPRKPAELERLLAHPEETLVAFESPRRLSRALRLLAGLDPERPVAVCRELTKLHEEVRRGSAAELAAHYEHDPPRGEIVLAIGAAPPGAARRAQAREALRQLVAAGAKPRPAARIVAGLTGVAANELYRDLTGSGQ
ncbi:MAG TPA: 16S rRNA (cytidine(1402)-2'-O)-methyltransferase [Solirubrobacteraceae bacterium]|nr:16S rRNA (cytidine(1402)-2'-O)-methyltransferase [Solirubrobacteraceae bacterium]